MNRVIMSTVLAAYDMSGRLHKWHLSQEIIISDRQGNMLPS
jgi:hypothetical protein